MNSSAGPKRTVMSISESGKQNLKGISLGRLISPGSNVNYFRLKTSMHSGMWRLISIGMALSITVRKPRIHTSGLPEGSISILLREKYRCNLFPG